MERTVKIIPRVQAQPLPWRNPTPVASQTRLKKRKTPPITTPTVPIRVPTVGIVENSAETPIIAMLTRNPRTPIRISIIPRIVMPIGREGFCII